MYVNAKAGKSNANKMESKNFVDETEVNGKCNKTTSSLCQF